MSRPRMTVCGAGLSAVMLCGGALALLSSVVGWAAVLRADDPVVAGVFEYELQVVPADLDELGHVNNLVYVKWLLEAAVAHSTALGWSPDAYRALGRGWVVRSHFIEYLGPAFAGDRLVMRTWVSEMKRVTSGRKYELYRSGESVPLLRGETQWAFVIFATHQITRVPAEMVAVFAPRMDMNEGVF
ncbi:MAG: acyl-CoA thioesterase [Planctomyces sp.]